MPTLERRHHPPYHDVPIRGMVSEVNPWLARSMDRGDSESRHYHINTGGGAFIDGDVQAGRDFTGRDMEIAD